MNSMRPHSNRILAVLLSLLVALSPFQGAFAVVGTGSMPSQSHDMPLMQMGESVDMAGQPCGDAQDMDCCEQASAACMTHCLHFIAALSPENLDVAVSRNTHTASLQKNLLLTQPVSSLYRPPRA